MPEIRKVLTTVQYDSENYQRLCMALAPAEIIHCNSKDEQTINNALQEVDVAILASDLDDRYLKAPQLKWVHCDHAGLNNSVKPEVFERGLLLTSSAGRSSPALAEHIMVFMLNFAFHFVEFYQAKQQHHWGVEGQEGFHCLYRQTVGVFGMGNVGQELALRAKAFGMKVIGYSREKVELPSGFDVKYSKEEGDSIDPLLVQSDFIVLAVPLTDETYHMISSREFKLMKSGAVLVNMARGPLVDDEAMIAALRTGLIAGAGLDVYSQEPLPQDSPLWEMPNVLMTPHVTPQVPSRIGRSLDIICDNISRYRAGEPLRNLQEPFHIFTLGKARQQ